MPLGAGASWALMQILSHPHHGEIVLTIRKSGCVVIRFEAAAVVRRSSVRIDGMASIDLPMVDQ